MLGHNANGDHGCPLTILTTLAHSFQRANKHRTEDEMILYSCSSCLCFTFLLLYNAKVYNK